MTDTECYAENVHPEQVLAWLRQRLGALRLVDAAAGVWLYQLAGSQPDHHDLQLTQPRPGLLGIWWLGAEPWPAQAESIAPNLRKRVSCSNGCWAMPTMWDCIPKRLEPAGKHWVTSLKPSPTWL